MLSRSDNNQGDKPTDYVPKYYATYAVSRLRHAYIIISRSIPPTSNETEEKHVVLASFGLHAKHFYSQLICNGAFSEAGEIMRDDYHLSRESMGKSFSITQEQALQVLDQVKEDASISKKPKRKLLTPASLPDFVEQFTEKEKAHYVYFKYEIDGYSGGPQFNGRDFNCKKYALTILRFLKIRDIGIEKHRFPTHNFPGSKPILFDKNKLNYWTSDLNVVDKKEHYNAINYPPQYNKIYSQEQNPAKGALALLKDYSADSFKNSFLHFKRHYKKRMRELITDLEADPKKYNNVESIVNYIMSFITRYRDMTGSLQRRLDFLLERVDTPAANNNIKKLKSQA